MLTKEEAMKAAFAYFKQHGIDEKRLPDLVHLITRKRILEDEEGMKLKRRRPDAWTLLEQTFRDRWSIVFGDDLASPPHYIVNVDAETGEVTFPDLL